MRAPFQLDLHVPNFNWPDVPPDQLFDRLADIALTAEESGFSSISLMDHLHQIPPVGPPENFMFDGHTMIAGLDGVTVSMPDVYDLESVALAGETLGAVVGTRTG